MNTCRILLLAVLLAGCAGQTSEPSYYLLRPAEDVATRPLQPSTAYVLGAVHIAPYIDRPGLVLETAEGRIHPARQHLWAEPISVALRNFLGREISRALGEDLPPRKIAAGGATIDVSVDQLHGTQEGEAVLVARWWLVRDAQIADAHQFAARRTLDGDGYAALARAQQALLSNFAMAVATELGKSQARE